MAASIDDLDGQMGHNAHSSGEPSVRPMRSAKLDLRALRRTRRETVHAEQRLRSTGPLMREGIKPSNAEAVHGLFTGVPHNKSEAVIEPGVHEPCLRLRTHVLLDREASHCQEEDTRRDEPRRPFPGRAPNNDAVAESQPAQHRANTERERDGSEPPTCRPAQPTRSRRYFSSASRLPRSAATCGSLSGVASIGPVPPRLAVAVPDARMTRCLIRRTPRRSSAVPKPTFTGQRARGRA